MKDMHQRWTYYSTQKYKLLCYYMLLDVIPVVYLCDAIVNVVDSEMYLGNKLYQQSLALGFLET